MIKNILILNQFSLNIYRQLFLKHDISWFIFAFVLYCTEEIQEILACPYNHTDLWLFLKATATVWQTNEEKIYITIVIVSQGFPHLATRLHSWLISRDRIQNSCTVFNVYMDSLLFFHVKKEPPFSCYRTYLLKSFTGHRGFQMPS